VAPASATEKAPDATHVKAASSRRTPRLACGGQGTTSQAAQNPGFFVFPATDPGSKLFLGLAEGDPPAHFTPRPSCSADFVPRLRRNLGAFFKNLISPATVALPARFLKDSAAVSTTQPFLPRPQRSTGSATRRLASPALGSPLNGERQFQEVGALLMASPS